MLNETVALPGAEMDALLCNAEGAPKPGVVVLHEIFGVNAFVRFAAEKIAAAGYVTLAPDLYHRIAPGTGLGYDDDSRDRALALDGELDHGRAQGDAEAAVDWLRAHPACNGKVAAVGFCLGGKVTMIAACNGRIDAGVAFYPTKAPSFQDRLDAIVRPVQIHLGGDDPYTPADIQDLLRTAARRNAGCEYYLHPGAKHGFFNPIRESAHNPEGAARAFTELSRFLETHIGV